MNLISAVTSIIGMIKPILLPGCISVSTEMYKLLLLNKNR